MRFSVFATVVALTTAVLAQNATQNETQAVIDLQEEANDNMFAALQKRNLENEKLGVRGSCTLANVAIRREYGSLSRSQKLDYVRAVKCLQNMTALTSQALIPGVRSRFDDFVGTHINQTLTIHNTGNFLPWHRYFTWAYEQDLRNLCGYQGYQPYWDWPRYVSAPQNSPIFDGSDTSLGGNGAYIPHNGTLLTLPGIPGGIQVAAGLGSGCVETGPFKDMVVNLGPLGATNYATGPDGGLGYNPRCLRRDLSPDTATRWTNITAVVDLLLQPTIGTFWNTMLGSITEFTLGVHGGGHYTIGGDPGEGLFTSPGDPAFYTHHAQIDRMWTIWQNLSPIQRTNQLYGTNTMFDMPPSANTTLNDIVSLGYTGHADKKIADLMSVVGGPFCYIYV